MSITTEYTLPELFDTRSSLINLHRDDALLQANSLLKRPQLKRQVPAAAHAGLTFGSNSPVRFLGFFIRAAKLRMRRDL